VDGMADLSGDAPEKTVPSWIAQCAAARSRGTPGPAGPY
jgi:hypothetical protein